MRITYGPLETLPYSIDTTPADINPGCPAPDDFTDEPNADGSRSISIAGPAGSAGLSKRTLSIADALSLGLYNFEFSYDINPDANAALFAQVYETDPVIVDQNGIVYIKGSSQYNLAEGGEFDIGGWTPTGIKTAIPCGVWTTVIEKFGINPATQTLVWQSIQGIAVPASITTFQGNTGMGWTPYSQFVLQIQNCLASKPGIYSRNMRNIYLTCSDMPL